jgi:retron-type reverse transcriptase
MSPLCDAGFSDHRYGVRPGRRAHHAVEQACQDLAEGYRWEVDLDGEKCSDHVHHDRLMSRVAKKIQDKRLLKRIRRDLTAGILQEGLVSQRAAGPPQGSPRSPRWSNLLWESLDQALDRRGPRCCRDADAANVYVRS